MKYITSEARKINVDKSVVKKCIKRVAIASVAAVIGMNLFACTKPETDKITIEFDKDLKTNEQKSKENETKQYKQRQLKKGESLDGKITGRTRIENGLVMEWQEDFQMDKTIVPTRIEYKESYHLMIYNIDGVQVTVVTDTNGRNFTTDITNVRAEFATITEGVNKSNEQVLKSVAANKALNKAMQKMTK